VVSRTFQTETLIRSAKRLNRNKMKLGSFYRSTAFPSAYQNYSEGRLHLYSTAVVTNYVTHRTAIFLLFIRAQTAITNHQFTCVSTHIQLTLFYSNYTL
jgi:hypothetical protein